MFYGILILMYFYDDKKHSSPHITLNMENFKPRLLLPMAQFWQEICHNQK